MLYQLYILHSYYIYIYINRTTSGTSLCGIYQYTSVFSHGSVVDWVVCFRLQIEFSSALCGIVLQLLLVGKGYLSFGSFSSYSRSVSTRLNPKCADTFKAFVHVMLTDSPLADGSNLARPNIKESGENTFSEMQRDKYIC